jgi:exonuclease VII small subunit
MTQKKSDKSNSSNLSENLKKLAQIVSWFESESELDVEKGLEYVKEGADLIKSSRERLSQIENDFKEIKKEIQKSPKIN